MTWGEWLNSEFNTHNWYTENNEIFNADGKRLVYVYDNNTIALLTNNLIVLENGEYQFENSSDVKEDDDMGSGDLFG